MKIRTVTFHRAHNHGSVLQAYALQTFATNILMFRGIECDYKIIDYYPKVQRELYSIIKSDISLKGLIKNCIALKHYSTLSIRHNRFNAFVEKYLNLTRAFDTEQSLQTASLEGDIFISGSDQIWNVRSKDFSSAYYLNFAPAKAKKISYAASFGPLEIDWAKYDATKYAALLGRYDYISVRETGSADNVERLIGVQPEVHVDPTLLLSADEWRQIQSDANYNEGKYILLYCLEPTKIQLRIASAISKKIGLPIVVLRYNNKNDWFNTFVHRYDAGPLDFLSYIDHAAMVISSSFHGTVFSMIYHKPFYVLNGLHDNRISSILYRAGLESRSIETVDDVEKVTVQPLDNRSLDTFLAEEKRRSTDYLTKAMGLS